MKNIQMMLHKVDKSSGFNAFLPVSLPTFWFIALLFPFFLFLPAAAADVFVSELLSHLTETVLSSSFLQIYNLFSSVWAHWSQAHAVKSN